MQAHRVYAFACPQPPQNALLRTAPWTAASRKNACLRMVEGPGGRRPRSSGFTWAQRPPLRVPGEGVLAEAGTPGGIHSLLVDVCGLNTKVTQEGLRWRVRVGEWRQGEAESRRERSRERRDQENERALGQKEEGQERGEGKNVL